MRKRPRPDQIAKILREVQADLDAGLNVNQACRKAGILHRPPTTAGSPSRRTRHRVEQIRVSELEAENRPTQAPGRRTGPRPSHAPGGLEKKAMTAARRRLIAN